MIITKKEKLFQLLISIFKLLFEIFFKIFVFKEEEEFFTFPFFLLVFEYLAQRYIDSLKEDQEQDTGPQIEGTDDLIFIL